MTQGKSWSQSPTGPKTSTGKPHTRRESKDNLLHPSSWHPDAKLYTETPRLCSLLPGDWRRQESWKESTRHELAKLCEGNARQTKHSSHSSHCQCLCPAEAVKARLVEQCRAADMIYCLAAVVLLSACASCHHQLGRQRDKEGCAWPWQWRLTPAAPCHCQGEVATRALRLVAGKEHVDPEPGCSALPKPICVPPEDRTLLCTAPEGAQPRHSPQRAAGGSSSPPWLRDGIFSPPGTG